MPRGWRCRWPKRRRAIGYTRLKSGWRAGLLLAQDRLDSGKVPITHDFLATMLGTDRPSVSLAAGILQKKELLRYTRGSLHILNRKRREEFA